MKRLAWLMLLVAGAVSAESSISQGGYDVHYSAVPSISIPPQVARQYAITRSANRALLNIAVLRDGAARMLAEGGEDAATLRKRVTSPNGTTQAALERFEAGGLRALVRDAVLAAERRGGERSRALGE